MSFFDELAKIHYQKSVPSAILMSIRGRFERLSGKYQNRIGSAFPNGDQSVLLFGPAGSGKTTVMTKIYNGLKLQSKANFIESGGFATSIGLKEMMQQNAKSITFLDEMDWDNKHHLALFKQVANGKIYRQKAGSSDGFKFDGMICAATNSISVPSGNKAEHLMATLDRFIVVKTKRSELDHDKILDTIISGKIAEEVDDVDWDLIIERLNSNWDSPLTIGESALIKEMWARKLRECTDPSREQFRNMHKTKDCLQFVKRMEQCEDVSKNRELTKEFINLVNDLVIVNNGDLVWMERVEQEIFNIFKESKTSLSPQNIMNIYEEKGYSIERRTLTRKLRRLVEQGFIFKLSHGQYGISNEVTEQEEYCPIRI